MGSTVWRVVRCLVIPVLAVAACSNQACAEQVTVAGSTTVQPVVAAAAKEFEKGHPDVHFLIGAGGSGHGIKAVAGGQVQIGMASRALKSEEKDQNPDLAAFRIGLDGVVLVVHVDNPVKQMTRQQIVDIYTGKITNWKEVGGPSLPIYLVSTNERHGTFDAFVDHLHLEAQPEGHEGGSKRLFFKNKGAAAYGEVSAQAVDGNEHVLAALSTKPGSVGYTSFGAAQRIISRTDTRLKMLDFDGVRPSENAILGGAYRLQRPLLVVTKGRPSGTVAAFIGFLQGAEGQRIVKDLDYIPTPDAR